MSAVTDESEEREADLSEVDLVEVIEIYPDRPCPRPYLRT
jgi:hypothetical protein